MEKVDILNSIVEPNIIPIGEPTDELADLMDLFETQTKYKLLFSTNKDKIPEKIEEKVYSKIYNQTIFSFTVNSQVQADLLWFKNMPGPFDIISCAYRFKKQGQHIRVFIDCITEIRNYQEEYKPLIEVLNDFLKPEQVVIGPIYGPASMFSEEEKKVYSWFKENLECKDVVIA